ncbi:MFS transporter [Umezawaea sp.]|uniref:MFS transporter n=1 Tax=Umezawaea sp. TaxID=1955258 RepID=UPI002ED22A29
MSVLALTGITVSLQQTVVIPLLPALPRLLDVSAADASWAVTVTLLAGAVAAPVSGRLADMWGKRRLLLICLASLVAGSAVAALSGSLAPLLVGRALQGLATGVVPLGISLMRDHLPQPRLAPATAMMSASLGVGASLGLPLSALLVQYANWRLLFWVSAGLAALAALLVSTLVAESRQRTGGRFDALGAALLTAALVCLLLTISKGGLWGWTSFTIGLPAGSAVVLLAAFGAWELRARQPLIDLRASRVRQVALTNASSAVFAGAMLMSPLAFTQLLQMPVATGYGLGQTIFIAGLLQAPGGLCMMAMSPLSALITRTAGPRRTLMIGTLVVAAGYGFAALAHSHLWQVLLCTMVVGAGIGLGYGAVPSLIMAAVPVTQTAAANSLNNLCRALGTSSASAVTGLLLVASTTSVGTLTVPSETAIVAILLLGAGAALIALLISAFIPRRAVERSPAVAATTPT